MDNAQLSKEIIKCTWIHGAETVSLKNQLEVFDNVLDKYNEPHRKYHNTAHIMQMQIEAILAKETIPDYGKMAFAIWMHDVIYDHKGNNEARSIEYLISLDMNPKMKSDVAKLIKATEHKSIPDSFEEKILVDIDLSILGKDKELFDSYESGIREEYSFVNDKDFRNGRVKILENFLGRQRIYNTDFFFNKYEKNARENLEYSIKKLSK